MPFLIGTLAGLGAAFVICIGVALVREWREIFSKEKQ